MKLIFFPLELLVIPVYLSNHLILVTIENLNAATIHINLFDPKYMDIYSSVLKVDTEFLEVEHLGKKDSTLGDRCVCLLK